MEELRNIFKHLMEFKLYWGEEVKFNFIDEFYNTHKLSIMNISSSGFNIELYVNVTKWNDKSSEELKEIEQEIDDAVNKIKHINYQQH